MRDLAELTKRDKLTIVGLISGTSMDGIDAAVAEIEGAPDRPEIRQRGFVTVPYPEPLRQELLGVVRGDAYSAADLSRLDHEIGDCFGAAATRVVEEAGISPDQVDLVGSHGQTVWHDPARGETWQLGAPARIANRVRVPVVSDFRRADMAAGGQGAPLVPLLDALVFRHEEKARALLNIGGIANVTVLPPGSGVGGVTAFDTGPGNVLIDEFLQHSSQGRIRFDDRGKMAAAGQPDDDLLAGFLEHPYFYERPPKSTGREVFGASFVALTLGEWARVGENLDDLVATLTEFTVLSIAGSIREYVLPEVAVTELFVSGGGVHNDTLMSRLTEELEGIRVSSIAHEGFSPDAKEALAFALLARETVYGRAGNVPGATGADSSVVLGTVTPAPLEPGS